MKSNKWFVRPAPKFSPKVRLVCLPYAGGAASTYLPWAEHLPVDVELVIIQPPGRASRMGEKPHCEMGTLVDELMEVFHEIANRPYILFGHSLGSRVAYELAQQCSHADLLSPLLLIASGSRAPHFPKKSDVIHELPDAEFVDRLRELNGTPEEVLTNEELIKFLIPLLRADFKIADMYRAEPYPLDCPIVVLGGVEDQEVSAEDLEGWRELSNEQCVVHWIPGGHFFIEESAALVLEKVNAAIISSKL